MRCPDGARLAAAVSGEDAQAARHIAQCPRCSADADDMLDIIALARRAPLRTPSAARRAELAEELLARAELADDLEAVHDARASDDAPVWVVAARRKRRAFTAFATIATLAAAVAAVLALGRVHHSNAVLPVAPVAGERIGEPDRAVAHVSPPPAAAASAAPREPLVTIDEGSDVQRDGNELELVDGAIAVDARDRAAAVVVVHGTRVAIAGANAQVTARHGAIESVRVFAGSVEMTTDDRHVAIAAGDVWTAPAPAPQTLPAPPPLPAPQALPAPPALGEAREASARAFRDGWTALRDGRNADAIAAFDRASDAAVAEDAAYWAAIASERLGDRAAAARRLRDFLARYPASPRVAAARSALERVTH